MSIPWAPYDPFSARRETNATLGRVAQLSEEERAAKAREDQAQAQLAQKTQSDAASNAIQQQNADANTGRLQWEQDKFDEAERQKKDAARVALIGQIDAAERLGNSGQSAQLRDQLQREHGWAYLGGGQAPPGVQQFQGEPAQPPLAGHLPPPGPPPPQVAPQNEYQAGPQGMAPKGQMGPPEQTYKPRPVPKAIQTFMGQPENAGPAPSFEQTRQPPLGGSLPAPAAPPPPIPGTGTPPPAPPQAMAPQGQQPALSGHLPPPSPPQVPPGSRVLVNTKTGEVSPAQDLVGMHLEQLKAIEEGVSPYLNHPDPEVRSMANIVLASAKAKVDQGTSTVHEAMKDAEELLTKAANTSAMRKSPLVKGVVGTAPNMKEQKFDEGYLEKADKASQDAIKLTQSTYNIRALHDTARDAQKTLEMLANTGEGAATAQLEALDNQLKIMHGRAVNYAEYDRTATSGGPAARFEQAYQKYLGTGQLSGAVLDGMKDVATLMRDSAASAAEGASSSAYEYVKQSPIFRTPEDAEASANRTVAFLGGKPRGSTSSRTTEATHQKYIPKPKPAAKNAAASKLL